MPNKFTTDAERQAYLQGLQEGWDACRYELYIRGCCGEWCYPTIETDDAERALQKLKDNA